DIDQSDEMHTSMIEAVPAGAYAPLAEAVEECLAAVGIEHVVLARDEEDRKPESFEHLVGVVEFVIARELRHVAGVNDEIGPLRQRLHLFDRFAEGGARVGVRRLVEADVAFADLGESEGRRSGPLQWRGKRGLEPDRASNSAVERKQRAGSGPSHAFQESRPSPSMSSSIRSPFSCGIRM